MWFGLVYLGDSVLWYPLCVGSDVDIGIGVLRVLMVCVGVGVGHRRGFIHAPIHDLKEVSNTSNMEPTFKRWTEHL